MMERTIINVFVSEAEETKFERETDILTITTGDFIIFLSATDCRSRKTVSEDIKVLNRNLKLSVSYRILYPALVYT
jgi:hypothetical protein